MPATPDPRLAAFAAQPLQPGDFYHTPEGYLVFTEQYHRRRGFAAATAAATAPGEKKSSRSGRGAAEAARPGRPPKKGSRPGSPPFWAVGWSGRG